MNDSERMFVSLIRCALRGETPTPIPGVEWSRVYDLADMSRTVYAVFCALSRVPGSDGPDEKLRERLRVGADRELYKETIQSYFFQAMLDALDQAQVSACPIKGLVLREDYPNPAMRSMSDADVLIRPQDKERARQAMLRAGYVFEADNGTHMAFVKPPFLAVELHEKPLSEYSSRQNALADIWDCLRPTAGHRYQIPPNIHYIYLLLHLDKHLSESGFGIRMLMDFWVFRKRYGDLLSDESVAQRLKAYGLHGLAQSVRALEGAWFDGDALPDGMEPVEAFILNGAVFGTYEQRMIRYIQTKAQKKRKKGAHVPNVFDRVFLPMSHLRLLYRELNQYPFLYPVCLVKRWVKWLKQLELAKERIHVIEGVTSNKVVEQDAAIRELYRSDDA